MDNKIIHFRDNEFELDVNVDKNTVWLTQAQISELFEKDRTVITRHINNIFKDEELDRDSVSAKNAHTAIDGKTYNTIFYNLDVIISVGYRVKSARGIKFRRWATEILSKYLTEGYVVNINRLKMENEKLKELQNMISLVHRVSLESDASKSEIMNLLSVVKEYEYALDLLDQYDHKTVSIEGKVSDREVIKVELNEVFIIIDEMKREFDSELFG